MKLKIKHSYPVLLAGILVGGTLVCDAFSQSSSKTAEPKTTVGAPEIPATPGTNSTAPSNSQQIAAKANNWHVREANRYKREWGVDIVGARRISSGEMIEFRYRVLDATKAKALNDKRSNAFMIDQATGKKLVVPQMEKVGLLRTTAPPQLNRVYWMIFANPGNIVKPGNAVNVVIGNFHVDGLIAQ
jgi:hypothetical protein